MKGSELFDDAPAAPAGPQAARQSAPAGAATPVKTRAASTRTATARKTRKGGKVDPDMQRVLGALAVLIVASGLWTTLSASPAADKVRHATSVATGRLVDVWDWANSGRPGYIPSAKRAAVARTLKPLVVADEVDAPGYDRAQFGTAWKDVDGNGCDQRADALARDLQHIRRAGRCTVIGGVLTDPYTGTGIRLTATTTDQIHVDQVVPLARAWREGAADWPAAKRVQFANTLTNLVAVTAATDLEKSDKDAADWQPDGNDRQCSYARKVVRIKQRWGLTVDKDEYSALGKMLGRCA